MKNAIRTLTLAGLMAGGLLGSTFAAETKIGFVVKQPEEPWFPGRMEIRRPGRQGEGFHGREDRCRGRREGPRRHRQPRGAGRPGLHHLHTRREARPGARSQGAGQQHQDDDGRRPAGRRFGQAPRRRAAYGDLGQQDRRTGGADDRRRGQEAGLGLEQPRRRPRLLRPVADRQGPGGWRHVRAGEGTACRRPTSSMRPRRRPTPKPRSMPRRPSSTPIPT